MAPINNQLKQALDKINRGNPPEQSTGKEEATQKPQSNWQHFSFTCNKEIVEKLRNIAKKEGYTLREIAELFLQRGIADYERKNGKAQPAKKDVTKLIP